MADVKKVKVARADKKEVQARWMDMQLARKNFEFAASIFRSPLPKVAYSKRKNGKKKRLNNTAIRRNTLKGVGHSIVRDVHPHSKHSKFFQVYIQAGMLVRQAEDAFSAALQGQEKKKKGSIKALIEEQAPKAVA